VPRLVIGVNLFIATAVIVGAAVYIGMERTDANGLIHEERSELHFLRDIASPPSADDTKCLQSFNKFTTVCEDLSKYNRTAQLAAYGVVPNHETRAPGSTSKTVSVAGRKVGGCPGDGPKGCQALLDDISDACVELDWFQDMEDDVKLPARAQEIECVLKGMSGEEKEVEATIFENWDEMPTFLYHLAATIYACYALALVCEDFFVAAIDMIIGKLGLSPDVAGATFMAAGSSAPELFVSAAGVFITHSPVGVGACAGSTMFNTMCIIGGSALIAGKPVPLQWRAVMRDSGIYVVSVVVLVGLLWDGRIDAWEAGVLLGIYVFYIILCAVYGKLVDCCCAVKKGLDEVDTDGQVTDILTIAAREKQFTGVVARRQTGSVLRGGATAHMDALLTAKVELSKDTTNYLNTESRARCDTSIPKFPNDPKQHSAARRKARTGTIMRRSLSKLRAVGALNGGAKVAELGRLTSVGEMAGVDLTHTTVTEQLAELHGEDEHEHGLCVIPKTSGGRLAWFISFPLMLVFTFTIPNCAKHPRLYILTFVFCIVWLGILVEIMVEHASETGALLGFSPGILGLTLLAAGTSFPDLVASLIVAKKGSIDMAVSNAFGSNNFDILLCLGLPWLLACCFFGPVIIDTDGIMTALFSLIVTTVIWIVYMMCTSWTLTPGVGFSMLTTYGTWLICQFMFDLFAPKAHE
jgi:K+-dependent Na+/Ca+ exchanger-like protein